MRVRKLLAESLDCIDEPKALDSVMDGPSTVQRLTFSLDPDLRSSIASRALLEQAHVPLDDLPPAGDAADISVLAEAVRVPTLKERFLMSARFQASPADKNR